MDKGKGFVFYPNWWDDILELSQGDLETIGMYISYIMDYAFNGVVPGDKITQMILKEIFYKIDKQREKYNRNNPGNWTISNDKYSVYKGYFDDNYTDTDIAHVLNVSRKTVKRYRDEYIKRNDSTHTDILELKV